MRTLNEVNEALERLDASDVQMARVAVQMDIAIADASKRIAELTEAQAEAHKARAHARRTLNDNQSVRTTLNLARREILTAPAPAPVAPAAAAEVDAFAESGT